MPALWRCFKDSGGIEKERDMTHKIDSLLSEAQDAIKFAHAAIMNELERRMKEPYDRHILQSYVPVSARNVQMTEQANHIMILSKLIGALQAEKCACKHGLPFSFETWIELVKCIENEKRAFEEVLVSRPTVTTIRK